MLQTSTNVLLIMVVVITRASTNQDHMSVNAKKGIYSVMMERPAQVIKLLSYIPATLPLDSYGPRLYLLINFEFKKL